MSLDQNLFTLHFVQNKDDPGVTDLVDPSNNAHYRRVLVPGNAYSINVYDPLSQSLLATATAPNAASKHKTIELHNPVHVVELKFTGTLSWKWRFQWEEHEFEWKREECFIIRKPDPAVLVAITKEPAGRLKTSTVQVLDYNLNRFDIQDRKGLEIVILTALLTFQDANDAHHSRDPTPSEYSPGSQPTTPPATAAANTPSGFFGLSRRVSEIRLDPPPQAIPPQLPARPKQRTGVERIIELHVMRSAQGEGEANEVHISEEGSVDDYARYAEKLLNDDAMLFVTIRAASARDVPKVLQVVEQTKRLRHKAGLDEEEDLHQYVIYNTEEARRPRRINLNDPDPNATKSYVPPSSISVHLSKIDMPELRPKVDPNVERMRTKPPPTIATVDNRESSSQGRAKAKDKYRERDQEKEREKEEKARKKAQKEMKKSEKNKTSSWSSPSSAAPPPNRLMRPVVNTVSAAPIPSSSPYSPHQPPLSSYPPPSSPYQTPPFLLLPPVSPSFPEPRPVSSYYGGGGFSSVGFRPPPAHPDANQRTRPASVYNTPTFPSAPLSNERYNSSYL